jgi:hypothetical protein
VAGLAMDPGFRRDDSFVEFTPCDLPVTLSSPPP